MTETILIIGVNELSSVLTSRLISSGHFVIVFDNDCEKAGSLVEALKLSYPSAELEAMDCSFNAAWEADVIIIATPITEQIIVASRIKDIVTQKIVVSITNHSNNNDANDRGVVLLEELRELLPHSKVVGAFGKSSISNKMEMGDLVIEGSNAEAASTVSKIFRDAKIGVVLKKNLVYATGQEELAIPSFLDLNQ